MLIGFIIAFITSILFLVLCTYILIFFLKKIVFPKKLLIATLSGVVLVSSIYVYEMYFFTFNEIDTESPQKGAGPVTSPTKRYTADAFYELYGGAAGGVNVWVEITDHEDNDEKKIIYYSDANTNVEMAWTDNNM